MPIEHLSRPLSSKESAALTDPPPPWVPMAGGLIALTIALMLGVGALVAVSWAWRSGSFLGWLAAAALVAVTLYTAVFAFLGGIARVGREYAVAESKFDLERNEVQVTRVSARAVIRVELAPEPDMDEDMYRYEPGFLFDLGDESALWVEGDMFAKAEGFPCARFEFGRSSGFGQLSYVKCESPPLAPERVVKVGSACSLWSQGPTVITGPFDTLVERALSADGAEANVVSPVK